MTSSEGIGPYLAPYASFLLLLEAERRLPGALAGGAFVLKVVVPAALVASAARRGQFPELRGFRLGPASLLDVAVGILIAALWAAPFAAWPHLPRGAAFDPQRFGAATLPLRLLGFSLVTPFVEELFVRSFLARAIDSWRSTGAGAGRPFRELPVGRFSRWSFWGTVLWFTLSHAPWEYAVAAPTGLILNLWLVRRRELGATIVAHAAANGALFALVALGPWPLWGLL